MLNSEKKGYFIKWLIPLKLPHMNTEIYTAHIFGQKHSRKKLQNM
uniref:Neural Wiskott-Aldrich syndrome protein-like n=1 Tax=Phallusia mammillata TaxID=59560 RepID=A0A6F9DWX6_9ASCI|nr:neural Wiskott-Aldrich syndrome protein-like [Phallusia mammillata]